MNYYNDAVMMAYQLGIWERVPENGSQHAKRLDRLMQAGIGPGLAARIHAPIGLDIGAQSPAEIAVSVLAEAIAALRGRDARRDTAGGAAA